MLQRRTARTEVAHVATMRTNVEQLSAKMHKENWERILKMNPPVALPKDSRNSTSHPTRISVSPRSKFSELKRAN